MRSSRFRAELKWVAMINKQLVNPRSIAVVGASNDVKKPGGKILKNILDGNFAGDIFVVNPGDIQIQGLASHQKVADLPQVDLAILAIPARFCPDVIEVLAQQKNTRAFIVLSAGFSEADENGRILEKQMADAVNSVNGCLIGPNCIGVLNKNYNGVFTQPIPPLHKHGCDLISGSGATAVFVMEAGIPLGVKFSNVYSVGNGAQIGVEDVLEYMDLNYDPKEDPAIKLLYLETISNPQKLLKHAASLIRKGVKIAAIKAGSTDAGRRAAASHTGAIANSDTVVRALFKKAGIVYCSSREELLTVASIFNYKKLVGKNIAVITHAGGSAVMLTDALSKGGLNVPQIEGEDADKLLTYLHPGSSVSNPIDFLATGTAEQLGIIIDYCEHKFSHIDAMVVVFGSPGLFDVENVYDVLAVKLDVCKKPIYPVLPSVINAEREIRKFLDKGNINFPDEVILGIALAQVFKTPAPISGPLDMPKIDLPRIREVIENSQDGFLSPARVGQLLDAAGIPKVPEFTTNDLDELLACPFISDYPLVMKVVGPVHKTDIGGVVLNIDTEAGLIQNFEQIMKLEGATAVMVQPMISGMELFIGAKDEGDFGHLVLCGLGGIFIEVLKDVRAGIAPLSLEESVKMIRDLKSYKLLQGYRSKEGVNKDLFADIIQRVAALTMAAPEIMEMDINPLIGNTNQIVAVDTRILLKTRPA
jgi:acetyltransferase